jgi:hypothetical protein
VTGVILDRVPKTAIPGVKVIKTLNDGAALVELPRYQAFTPAAAALAREGFTFHEVAGNQGPILLTIVVPENHDVREGKVLFRQPIITEPGRERLALVVNIPQLSTLLRQLQDPRYKLEHIYDF